jgi:crotonobetainyl-CoA:carnitine CoA-transferase CaiB-like acyl-CoA transferase
MSGMASVTGDPDGPPMKVGVPMADIAAGMFTSNAIVAALFARERHPDKRGQYVDTTMLGGQIAMLTYQAGIWFTTGKRPERSGNRHSIITPYDSFRTADGYVNIAVGNDGIWQRFCNVLGMEEERDDPRFRTNADRLTNIEPLYDILDRVLTRYTTAELVEKLDAVSVPCGPIYNIDEIMSHPQIEAQQLVRQVPHAALGEVTVTGFPYNFHGTPLEMRYGPPVLGEHTREILRDLGYDDATINHFITDGAIEEPAGG